MKKDYYFTETEEENKARWQRVVAMTDAQINAAIAEDEDAQTPEHGAGVWLIDWAKASGGNNIILPLSVDVETAAFINEHHIDYQAFLSGVLKAFVESQQKSGV